MQLLYPLPETSTARTFPHLVGWVRNQRIGVTRGPLPIVGLLGGDSLVGVLLSLLVPGVPQLQSSDRAVRFDSQSSQPPAPVDVGNEPFPLLVPVSHVHFTPFHDIYLSMNFSMPLCNEFAPLNHPNRPKHGLRYPPAPRWLLSRIPAGLHLVLKVLTQLVLHQ